MKDRRGLHDLDERQLKELEQHFSEVSPPTGGNQEEAQRKLRQSASKFKVTTRRPSTAR